MRYAQIVLFDGFDPLDVIAPFEVLAAAADEVGSDLVVELVCAGEPRSFVSGVRGIPLPATSTLDPNKPGYVIIPGAAGPVDGDPDEVDTIPVVLARASESAIIPLVQQALDNPEVVVATVCGGSLVLGMAGIIEGRTAVTHTLGNDVLEAAGVNVVRGRVVDDGDFVSGGGVTSGLDLGLHLATREFGPNAAYAVEKLFEYERRGTAWYTDRQLATAV
ncbi:DJ-1/PfpI family protein [uncultured Microbacterium sp.]|uniref:DJ-1/PfpI family protein n=1 Tax=uncultured Microbacterium sp. TaxID=191216 RepID=UPI0035CAF873